MGISRDKAHKRRATGGKHKRIRMKRKFEMGRQPANTKIGEKKITRIRVRGGNFKFRALRLDHGNYSWAGEAVTRKTRILKVVYNSTNNELVRTNTLVKGSIILIDSTPFKAWYLQYYNIDLSNKKEIQAAITVDKKTEKAKEESKKGEEKGAKKAEEKGAKKAEEKEPKKPAEKGAKKEGQAKKAEEKEPKKPAEKGAKKEGQAKKAEEKPATDKPAEKGAKKEGQAKKETPAELKKSGKKPEEKGKGSASKGKAKQQEDKSKKELGKNATEKFARRNSNRQLEVGLADQFKTGRLYAKISSRPGQSGRCDGYILEGEELAFYLKKLNLKKRK